MRCSTPSRRKKTSLAPISSSARQRGARASFRAGLEVAAGKDEHRDPDGDLEARVTAAVTWQHAAGDWIPTPPP
jgi:hypothetical protein